MIWRVLCRSQGRICFSEAVEVEMRWAEGLIKKAGLKLSEIRQLEFLSTPRQTLAHLAACVW